MWVDRTGQGARMQLPEAVEPGTVWTWNAIGRGAWRLSPTPTKGSAAPAEPSYF